MGRTAGTCRAGHATRSPDTAFTTNNAEIVAQLMKFAVGLAAGYVLGSRAGRKKYEQIVAGLRTVRHHPAVQEAQQATMDLLQVGKDARTVNPVPKLGASSRRC